MAVRRLELGQKKQRDLSGQCLEKEDFLPKYFVEAVNRKEVEAQATENIYPSYYELFKSAPVLANDKTKTRELK